MDLEVTSEDGVILAEIAGTAHCSLTLTVRESLVLAHALLSATVEAIETKQVGEGLKH